MRREEVKIIKYITDDGLEFFDFDEANKHEEKLKFDELKLESVKIGPYIIYRIDNLEELELLIYRESGIRHVRFDINKLKYPAYICESTDSKFFYFIFQLLDDVIDDMDNLLYKLKNLK